ncbi:MAG TPA: MurR/RpiR family transcriptional regulator [Thermoclostridium sp.]
MPGCLFHIKELLETLTAIERQIALFILDFPNEVINMTIEELATSCSASTSSVVRFCKSMGYSGYKELCRAIAADLASNQNGSIKYEDIRPGDSTESILRNVCLSNISAIENTMSLINLESLENAVKAIANAPRVDFYGIGSSGIVALDAHNKFMRINKISMSSADPHEQILSATTLKKGDVAVLISYTGDTKDIIETAEIVKQTEATLISITRYGKNQLSKMADIQLYSSSSETMMRSGAMGSRISQMTIIDILYTAVTSCIYDDVKKYLDKTRFVSSRKHIRPNSV